MDRIAVLLAAGSLALGACAGPAIAAEEPVNAPASTRIAKEEKGLKTAIFAGGCFWGVEHLYRKHFGNGKGLIDAKVGYAGGHTDSPTYRAVCSGNTGRMSQK